MKCQDPHDCGMEIPKGHPDELKHPPFAIFRTTDEDYGNKTVFEIRNRFGLSVYATENGKEAQQKCDEFNKSNKDVGVL